MNPQLTQAACKCSRNQRSPTFGSMTAAQPRDIHGRCGIGRASMPATDALEAIPRRAVAPIDAAACRTGLRRVSRVHRDQRNAGQCRLVGQEGPQLGERPTVVRPALRPLNRYPRADMRQILDGNSAPGVCGLPNDSLAYPVVQVRGETRLLPAPSAIQALDILSAEGRENRWRTTSTFFGRFAVRSVEAHAAIEEQDRGRVFPHGPEAQRLCPREDQEQAIVVQRKPPRPILDVRPVRWVAPHAAFPGQQL